MEDEKVKEEVKRIVNELMQKAQAENIPLFNVEIRPTGVERFEKELEMLQRTTRAGLSIFPVNCIRLY